MIIDSTLPPWIEALRNVEEECPYGPPLGPVLKGILDESFKTKFDFMSFLWNLLRKVENLTIPDAIGVGLSYEATFIPGHTGYYPLTKQELIWSNTLPSFPRGPSPGCTDIVVVGKHPGRTEESTHFLFSGASGQEIKRCLAEKNIHDFLDSAYFTNVSRFQPPPGGKFKQGWIKECAWLLWAELIIIRPKVVLLLGSEAIKHFHGRHTSVTKNRGAVMPIKLQCADEEIVIDSFPTMHPAAVVRETGMREGLASDLARCSELTRGTKVELVPRHYQDDDGRASNHVVLRTVHQVREYVEDLLPTEHRTFAIDCEWAGKSPWSDGKLLTIQISHAKGQCVLIPLHRHPRLPVPRKWELLDSKNGKLIKFRKPTVTEAVAYNLEMVDDDGESALGFVPFGGDVAIAPDAFVEVLNVLIPNFTPDELDEVRTLLKQLLERPDVRMGGHNFRADYPWLNDFGLSLAAQFLQGFDTMLAHHLLFEGAKQDLSSLVLKYTDAGRYDIEIQEWAARLKIMSEQGFGMVPEHVLYIYALFDGDVTWRINDKLNGPEGEYFDNHHEDRSGLSKLLQSEINACMGILEIERCGMLVDRGRIMDLAVMYSRKRDSLVGKLRERINWPHFNFRSVFQARELLFGEGFNGKKRDHPNVPTRIRPLPELDENGNVIGGLEGGYCCHLTPIKTTDRPPVSWDKVVQQCREKEHAPSTDKETLGILAAENEVANQLRKLRFVDQVCKNFTSMPTTDPTTGEVTEGGLMQHVNPDGRIRTHILQILETGRWASRKPNLQNLPKRREPELHALFASDEDKPSKIRSVFMAQPGHVLIEADYMQAELIVLALLSGDPAFWNVLMDQTPYPTLVTVDGEQPYRWLHPEWVRNCEGFKEGDFVPSGTRWGDYRDHAGNWHVFSTAKDCVVKMIKWKRDLHAERAISGFQMPYCAALHGPPKAYVERVAPDKRIAGKTVNFGIPYGRGAAAIARELKQEGVQVTTDDCQLMIDGFYGEFRLVTRFLDICRRCVSNPGYLLNPFGRYRRFETTDDNTKIALMEREACNFPIQSTVAECLNLAIYNAWRMRAQVRRDMHPLNFRIVLGVHDALMFEVPVNEIDFMVRSGGFIDWVMSKLSRIPMPRAEICNRLYNLADPEKFVGVPGNPGYAIGVDKEIFLRWDERPDRDELAAIGVPEPYLPRMT